ncbi:hypothetical protein XELAEV_18025416mg [Xenopus laevis]|uniref:RING-CH-type domain-containing protein n=1 Tax=Xenopus laevis TaxID=8355 RepID=A0A974D1Y3_XENLA|nr:hypothetical protein XELAEV_18025416mg [Xenopus laevis]
MKEELSSRSVEERSKWLDLRECFIIQDGQDELHHFCDCKDLIAHQNCLLKWIQKGTGNEDPQRCKACTAKSSAEELMEFMNKLSGWQICKEEYMG